MKRKVVLKTPAFWILGGLVAAIFLSGFLWLREPTRAFGGNFAPWPSSSLRVFRLPRGMQTPPG